MTNKMAARDLLYELGLLGYGNSKLTKYKIEIKKTGTCSSSLVYDERVFQMRQRMVSFSTGTNGE